ncbi:MAG: iron chelate uptake ABC transporter family permease subunit [Gemmatimonadetes bacterium]|nr:iron chelate uptake ABC transporter family permease subunit [Gemmatimonadota bacterium]
MSTLAPIQGTTASQSRITQLRFWLLLGGLTALLLVSITLGVTLGPVDIPVGAVWRIAASETINVLSDITSLELNSWVNIEANWTKAQFNIIWLIRFPRVLIGVFVGAGLAVVGVTMQALVRNPLADPYILGISSGASVGAVMVLAFGAFAFAGIYAISVGAFLGAILTFLIVFLLAQSNGRLNPARLILAGVAVAYFFSGLTSFITLTSDNRELARAVLAWLLGSLAGTDWEELTLPTAVLFFGSVYLVLQARGLNALIVGDETAATLGVDLTRFRPSLFGVVSLVTGVMVAVSGAIGFIGLMIPHIVRLMVGTDHRRVLPVSIFVGSIFLILVDVIARTAFDPVELPVGVITSLLGGPFFLWLLHRQMKERGGM